MRSARRGNNKRQAQSGKEERRASRDGGDREIDGERRRTVRFLESKDQFVAAVGSRRSKTLLASVMTNGRGARLKAEKQEIPPRTRQLFPNPVPAFHNIRPPHLCCRLMSARGVTYRRIRAGAFQRFLGVYRVDREARSAWIARLPAVRWEVLLARVAGCKESFDSLFYGSFL